MNETQKLIAIAEACPFVFGNQDGKYVWRPSPLAEPILFEPFSDLNAMHEAEQSLWLKDWTLRDIFVDHLSKILNPIHGYRMQDGVDLLDATAAQRAEAFLRTLNLWRDEP